MTATKNIADLQAFDGFLRGRCAEIRSELRERLAEHPLTLSEVRVTRVLIPMVGVYTPGLQALPACAWEFVELVTHEGPIGTGEWSIELSAATKRALAYLREHPEKNLLDEDLEEPLFMAWWDLVGQVLQQPLHELWGELFGVGFTPPSRVPLAAYSWQRFSDSDGNDAVTYDSWPAFASQQVAEGYRTLKLSMTNYQPEDYISIIERIRTAIPPEVDVRVDAHGSWNFVEARRIMKAIEPHNISYIEQPINALMPERFYDKVADTASPGGYQPEYYFRKLEQLRWTATIPISCHWWTPPIIHPPGATVGQNAWDFDWYMIARYDPVDIANPDIGLGVFGVWRLLQMARFMGLHVTLHSNFELAVQSRFRGAMLSALGYYPESGGLYLGTPPRLCMAMDTEYNQVRDDVIVGGKLAIVDGHLELSPANGHGTQLDPDRLTRYRYSEDAVRPHRNYASRLYEHYLLDRPRRTTMSGWPKQTPDEQVDRRAYPYDLTGVLGAGEQQDIDVELNR